MGQKAVPNRCHTPFTTPVPKPQIIVHRDLDILFRAQIPLGGLDGEGPSRNLICSRSPPFFRHSLAQMRRRSWGAEVLDPDLLR
jgi:hypothetical protein